MKSLVVYQSATGFTKQYAEWIAEDLGIKAESIENVKSSHIEGYDLIIFGGWIMGGMITGLDKVRKMKPKKLVVFCVGASPHIENVIDEMLKKNNLKKEEMFYMSGGIRYEKLGFMYRNMLKMFAKSLDKKKNKTEDEKETAEALKSSYDISDRKYTKELLDYVKTLK